MEQQNNLITKTDFIDFKKYFLKLVENWKFILTICAIAAFVGIVVAVLTKGTYSVETKIAPESGSKSSSGAMGSLGSLASMAGINIGAMSTSDAISPDLYPEVVSSIPFITDLFSVPVEFKRGDDEVYKTTYYDYLSYYQKSNRFSKGLPKKDIEPAEPVDIAKLTREQQDIVGAIRDKINLSVDTKSFVIKVNVTDQDPDIAFLIANTVVENLKTYVSDYRTQKVRDDLAYYEMLYEESQAEFFEAQQKYAKYIDSNQGVVRQSALAEQQRLQDEMQLKYALYNSCASQVQSGKAQVQRETPVFVTVIPPTVPLNDNESGVQMCIVAVLLGFLLAVIWVLWAADAVKSFLYDSNNSIY